MSQITITVSLPFELQDEQRIEGICLLIQDHPSSPTAEQSCTLFLASTVKSQEAWKWCRQKFLELLLHGRTKGEEEEEERAGVGKKGMGVGAADLMHLPSPSKRTDH